jgi:hypothetical protein
MKYTFKNYRVELEKVVDNTLLKVYCKIEGKEYERYYDFKGQFDSIEIDGEYICLNYPDFYYQIKLEYDTCLVIDTFDYSEEHLDCIGSHEFWDDVK